MDYLTKLPETPEDYACLMLRTTFELIDKGVQLALILPEQGAKMMKLSLNLLEKKVYPTIGLLIEPVEDGLVSYCDVMGAIGDRLDTNDGDSGWCAILFNCRAFIEVILDENMRGVIASMIPFASDEQKRNMTTDYAMFTNFICKMSLGSIVSAFVGAQLSQLYKQIDSIGEQVDNIKNVRYVLDEYDEVLDGAYVYDVLAEYDKFAKCAFTVCDFDKESFDARESVLKKLYLVKGGDKGYELDTATDFIASVYGIENEINSRVRVIQEVLSMGMSDPVATCRYITSSIKPRVEKRKASGLNSLAKLSL